MTDKRRQTIISKLDKWGENIKCLRQKNASGATTARAVVLLDELDKEIRRRSKDKYSIDHVTRELMTKRKVSLGDLEESVEGLIGSKSKTLRSSLLQ